MESGKLKDPPLYAGPARGEGIALVATASVSSVLSLLGSLCIIHLTLRRIRNTLHARGHRVYHHAMLCLSSFDVIVSCTLLLQPWLIEPEYGYPWSVGTRSTCSAVGFFMRFPVSVSLVNSYLSLFFMLRVCYGKRDRDLARYQLPCLVLALVLPLVLGAIGLATQSINPNEFFQICDMGPYPPGCDQNQDVECLRGSSYFIQDWVYSACLLIASLTAVYGMVRVAWSARQRYSMSRQFSYGSSFERAAAQRIQQVSTQAILYTAVYLNTVFWSILGRVLFDTKRLEMNSCDNDDGGSSAGNQQQPDSTGGTCRNSRALLALQFLAYWFFPLQGAFNFYVFIRPILKKRRQRRPDERWARAVLGILSRRPSPPSSSGQQAIRDDGNNNNLDVAAHESGDEEELELSTVDQPTSACNMSEDDDMVSMRPHFKETDEEEEGEQG